MDFENRFQKLVGDTQYHRHYTGDAVVVVAQGLVAKENKEDFCVNLPDKEYARSKRGQVITNAEAKKLNPDIFGRLLAEHILLPKSEYDRRVKGDQLQATLEQFIQPARQLVANAERAKREAAAALEAAKQAALLAEGDLIQAGYNLSAAEQQFDAALTEAGY